MNFWELGEFASLQIILQGLTEIAKYLIRGVHYDVFLDLVNCFGRLQINLQDFKLGGETSSSGYSPRYIC